MHAVASVPGSRVEGRVGTCVLEATRVTSLRISPQFLVDVVESNAHGRHAILSADLKTFKSTVMRTLPRMEVMAVRQVCTKTNFVNYVFQQLQLTVVLMF